MANLKLAPLAVGQLRHTLAAAVAQADLCNGLLCALDQVAALQQRTPGPKLWPAWACLARATTLAP